MADAAARKLAVQRAKALASEVLRVASRLEDPLYPPSSADLRGLARRLDEQASGLMELASELQDLADRGG